MRRSLAVIAVAAGRGRRRRGRRRRHESGDGAGASTASRPARRRSSPGPPPADHPSIAAPEATNPLRHHLECAIAELQSGSNADPAQRRRCWTSVTRTSCGSSYSRPSRPTRRRWPRSRATRPPRWAWPWCGTHRATPSGPRRPSAILLKDHPDDQDAHYSLAIVYFSDGRIDQAPAGVADGGAHRPHLGDRPALPELRGPHRRQQTSAAEPASPLGNGAGPLTPRARPARPGCARARSR